MLSTDFRHIASAANSERADRLFRAAVSAFCSLTRPTKREIAQLDDLTTPLLPLVSAVSKRYVAAALSDCRHVPPLLVHLLVDEPVEISAPLLVRSSALSDVDLIALIGRHGLPHARAIARRDDLHPTISSLIRALEAQHETGASLSAVSNDDAGGDKVEAVRDRLRAMMQDRASPKPAANKEASLTDKLQTAALTGVGDLFVTAMGKELGISADRLRPALQADDRRGLSLILKALDLSEQQAFLITAALHPARFPDAAPIRLFLEAYRAIDPDEARAHLDELGTHPAAAARG